MPSGEIPTPLEYGQELTFEKAKARLAEISGIVDGVRGKYALPTGDSTALTTTDVQRVNPEDQELLTRCIGVLLPMTMLDVVQEEARNASGENAETTMIAEISRLQMDIFVWLSGFENTGVQLLSAGSFFSNPPQSEEPKDETESGLWGWLKRLRG
ncbi:MAG: hypothetical protein HYS86_00650 [Candidatus Chisholmbacteria bacterium]|nr:hypothetical protein [Candidatus Chisholmbacteria bacterium]